MTDDATEEQARDEAAKLSRAMSLVGDLDPAAYSADETGRLLEDAYDRLDDASYAVHQWGEGDRP